MKTIDTYLNELPEPERTLCLEARAKAKKRRPIHHDAQTADSVADAIIDGFSWLEDGGDYDKFDAIHSRAMAGEFDKPAKKRDANGRVKGKPRKTGKLSKPVNVQDIHPTNLKALNMHAQARHSVIVDHLRLVETTVGNINAFLTTTLPPIMDRLTAIESSVAVIRSGATFMQQLEKDAPNKPQAYPTPDDGWWIKGSNGWPRRATEQEITWVDMMQHAPKGLETGDYCDASKEVADELTAMGWMWIDKDRDRHAIITWHDTYSLHGPTMVNSFAHCIKTTHFDRPTFLARARVTAEQLGLKAVKPEVLRMGDWVVNTGTKVIWAKLPMPITATSH